MEVLWSVATLALLVGMVLGVVDAVKVAYDYPTTLRSILYALKAARELRVWHVLVLICAVPVIIPYVVIRFTVSLSLLVLSSIFKVVFIVGKAVLNFPLIKFSKQ